MTAQPPNSAFQKEELREFHRIRSNFIDEFARLEIAVGERLRKIGFNPDLRKCRFDQCVGSLSKAKASPQHSGKDATALASLAQDCAPLQQLRHSLVHGILELGSRSGETVALFRNVADVVGGDPVYHVLSVAEFGDRVAELSKITHRARRILSPSSPPPPKPASTAGP